MAKISFKERIQKKEPIVVDGGMATSLYDKGFYINRSFEELSMTEAQAVREVTQGFKRVGAELLHANTFNAVIPKMTEYGLQDRHRKVIEAAVEIAQEVAGDECYVSGAIGPLGVVLEPLGPTSIAEAQSFFAENVKIFKGCGVDAVTLAGFHDLNELAAALYAVKNNSDLPVLALVGLQESMKTSYGNSIEEFLKICEDYDADIVGVCGEVGPSGALTAVQTMRPLTKKPIALLPNAGLPRYVNDQYIYLCNPDYIGKYAKRFAQAGANLIGGHCGMNESHIKAIANSVRMAQSLAQNESGDTAYVVPESIKAVVDKPQEPRPLEERSLLGQSLARGEKVVSVEIIPPHGVDCEKFLAHCAALEKGGVKFVNIPDGARAMARMSSLQLAAYVKNHFNIEPIPHFTTRDRNLIGLQSDLLGAYVNGVRNILLVTGDPPKLGNCPGATAVYDVDAIGLTHIAKRMNQGLDLGGSSFGKPAEFSVGVALNPTTPNRELEIKRFKYKIEAGADYAITQPIYDLENYKSFFDQLGPVDIPIIMGIWPLVSLRNAEFLKNEVPGVSVPDWVLEEMQKAGDSKEDAVKRGTDISIRTMTDANDLVAGFQVSAPFNRVSVALQVIQAVDGLNGSK